MCAGVLKLDVAWWVSQSVFFLHEATVLSYSRWLDTERALELCPLVLRFGAHRLSQTGPHSKLSHKFYRPRGRESFSLIVLLACTSGAGCTAE